MSIVSIRPRGPFAHPERRRTLKKIQLPLSYLGFHPLQHHLQCRIFISLSNLQTKHEPKLPLRVHLTKHVKRDIVGTAEVRTLENQDDFGEDGRFDRREDIMNEVRGFLECFGHGGGGDLKRSEGTKVR